MSDCSLFVLTESLQTFLSLSISISFILFCHCLLFFFVSVKGQFCPNVYGFVFYCVCQDDVEMLGLCSCECRTPLPRVKCSWGTKITATVPLLAYLLEPTATVPGSKASPSRPLTAASCSLVKRKVTNKNGYNISTKSWVLRCLLRSTQVRTFKVQASIHIGQLLAPFRITMEIIDTLIIYIRIMQVGSGAHDVEHHRWGWRPTAKPNNQLNLTLFLVARTHYLQKVFLE